MKININTNHIRICKLLGYTTHKTTDFIAEFLQMNKQNVNLYIKQIYSFIDSSESKPTIQTMIDYISKNKYILCLLKKEQHFTKENRILYMVLILLRDRHINLNHLSTLIGVSRRIIGNDLILAKDALNIYGLEINSSNAKGISLCGSEKNLKLASLAYLYKLFVEFDDLPALITKDYLNFFDDEFHLKLNKDIDNFIHEYAFDYFSQNKNLLKAFFIIYGNLADPEKPTLDSLSFDEFKLNFKDVIGNSKLKSCYNFLKVSSLGKILLGHLNIFLDTLKFCDGALNPKNEELFKELNKIKAMVFKNLSVTISKTNFLEKFVNKIRLAHQKSIPLRICDLEFLRFNLPEEDKLKCIKLFFTLRRIYQNIQFSNVIFLYVWSSHQESLSGVKNALVVFDRIPKLLFPIIKNKLLLIENMDVLDFVKPHELESHLANYDVNCIITFEKLNSENKYPFIKTYNLPIL
ncbi:hypothetical protein [Cetobacterium sp.]|uniref:hypothetical protein n=1 Tax=Cetobacterium sp. TaxID=2071632 RepID=UPI003F40F18C